MFGSSLTVDAKEKVYELLWESKTVTGTFTPTEQKTVSSFLNFTQLKNEYESGIIQSDRTLIGVEIIYESGPYYDAMDMFFAKLGNVLFESAIVNMAQGESITLQNNQVRVILTLKK